MTYTQTLEYLYSRLPMYQRVGAAAYKADLDNTIRITDYLGRPQNKLKCIHVAGTNGKGSSSHMLAAILQKAGYKTGLYTSPHLVDFRERIKINGKMIPKKNVVEFVEKHRAFFESIEPSFFEWTVALALDYFAQEEVDVAVIEVGLGGRLDSTNIITPKACLITNISYDHMNLLGNSIRKISFEKAGIIKARVPVVISQYQSVSAPVFSAVARENKAPIEFADKNYKVLGTRFVKNLLEVSLLNKASEKKESYQLDLSGHYQVMNLLGVLNVVEFVRKAGFMIEAEHVQAALQNVTGLTGLKGRWQKLGEKPLIIADTGHNEDGIQQVMENIRTTAHRNLHMVFGTVNDKDISSILDQLPKKAQYYFVKASIPRALDEKTLQALALKHGLKGKSYASVSEGLQAARKAAAKSDMIFIGGSTFVVGDALTILEG
ncbi:MAG TPA: folylpolyglutamate synthase/dihydrofolate synthase family protein [Bacteroidia bacterium]|nr:folylpolyglutamate synthase/dihydrofolate synthase family protein [Bacteroidia bacterium]